MPYAPPRICSCGLVVAAGTYCACQIQRRRERNQRHDANRPTARERGYDSRWRTERLAFLKIHCTCAMPGCGQPATVVDHIIPHRRNMRIFWDRSNWQPLCAPCHNSKKQRQERAGR